jgi:hypothetical protein
MEHSTLKVKCGQGEFISAVLFASYGNPTGICYYGYHKGLCHATSSLSVV